MASFMLREQRKALKTGQDSSAQAGAETESASELLPAYEG